MSVLPTRIQDLLDFFDLHAPVWQANAASIGLTTGQATAFNTAAQTARMLYNDQLSQQAIARAAVKSAQTGVRDTRALAAELIGVIKAYALTQPDPQSVYNLAQIPAPAVPSPMPPPGQPTDFRAILETTGAITLRWKCANPKGAGATVYAVRRKLQGESGFSFVGATGQRSFTDETLPQGPDSVQYIVQGQRGVVLGPASFPLVINFGIVGGGGLSILSQFSGPGGDEETRLAA